MADTSDWSKEYSKTYARDYWFNKKTGERSWEEPSQLIEAAKKDTSITANGARNTEAHNDRKRIREDRTDDVQVAAQALKQSKNERSKEDAVHIAIIVPFRDLHKEQKRKEQLDIFIPTMQSYLKRSGQRFRIYIIQQSDDGRKFNRGKLLNIGYNIAREDGCKVFVFHDVDLIPSAELTPYYASVPLAGPIHIARVWDRYSGNPKYVGGIVAITGQHFAQMNGFPNNFWGWGGEDDEMYNRMQETQLRFSAPSQGSIRDLEEMSIGEKINVLREHRIWKCMNKTEVLQEHADTWHINGLSDLKYSEISRQYIDEKGLSEDSTATAVIVTVDVHLNEHWTDLVCGVKDTQLDTPANVLKMQYEKGKKKS